jgi:pimeloyl-ACP methyl ester carboxylesterase
VEIPSSEHTQDTAPMRFVESDGISFAYRRFGRPAGTPVVFVQHFRGNLDNHDPAITDALAAGREVILFDNAGVGSSTGTAPDSVEAMARDAASFIDALGLGQIDLLAHSMGGEVGQVLMLERPELVRRAILVGTGPSGGEGMASQRPQTAELFAKVYERQDEMWLPIMFSPSPAGQAAGWRYLERIRARTEDRDEEVSTETAAAHRKAAGRWGAPKDPEFAYLSELSQPTLVVNGHTDIVIATVNSFILQQHMPDARLILFPDSGHGSHFQYPDLFVAAAIPFLDRPDSSGDDH